jgi:hypothetical protein
MRRKYVTVRCSRCNSVSQIKTDGVMTDVFLCPVCLDGEVEYRVERPRVHRVRSESPVEVRTLVTMRTR